MKVLIISLDKTLLGEKVSGGDAVERHREYGKFCDELNIIVFCLGGYEKQELSQNVFVWPTNSKSKLRYAKDAIKIAKQIYQDVGFDLIVCQDPFLTGWVGLKLKSKLDVKLLVHFHGDFWLNKKWLKEKWYNHFLLPLSKLVAKKADCVRVVSHGIKNKLIRNGIKKNKIQVIPTPVDLNKFLTCDAARVYELKKKYAPREAVDKIILFVGRLEKEKNLSWFLKVFKAVKQEYNNVRLLIIGEGSLKKKLQVASHKLQVARSVEFIGRVGHSDLTNYYHLADIVVLPSTSESFGKVLAEAAAAGRPCVATATTGAKEIIQDKKTGFLVPINNQKQMIEKIIKLLKDEKLAQQMGEKAREHVKKDFSSAELYKKIANLWQDVIRN